MSHLVVRPPRELGNHSLKIAFHGLRVIWIEGIQKIFLAKRIILCAQILFILKVSKVLEGIILLYIRNEIRGWRD